MIYYLSVKKRFISLVTLGLMISSCGNSESTVSEEQKTSSTDTLSLDTLNSTYSDLLLCLKESDYNKLESVHECLEKHKIDFETLSEEQVDSLFYKTQDALHYVSNQITPEMDMENDFDENGYLSPELTKKANEIGFNYDSEEGMYFYYVHMPYLKEKFYKHLSKAMKAYVDFKMTHDDKIAYDAGINIAPIFLAKRIVDLEKLFENGNFVSQMDVFGMYCDGIWWLCDGMDNTPAFNYYDNDLIFPEVKEAIEYVSKNGGVVAKEISKVYLAEVEKHEGKKGKSCYELFPAEEISKRLEKTYKIELE